MSIYLKTKLQISFHKCNRTTQLSTPITGTTSKYGKANVGIHFNIAILQEPFICFPLVKLTLQGSLLFQVALDFSSPTLTNVTLCHRSVMLGFCYSVIHCYLVHFRFTVCPLLSSVFLCAVSVTWDRQSA